MHQPQEFYPALAVFGMPPHEPKGGLNAALDQEPPEGEEQEHIGRALTLFQDISNFADRCNALCANLVHQLAALYHSGSRMHKNTPVCANHSWNAHVNALHSRI